MLEKIVQPEFCVTMITRSGCGTKKAKKKRSFIPCESSKK
jgi:hypothetical protein